MASGATARLALPYPVPADTVDVPRDVLALSAKLDPLVAVDVQGTLAARPAASTVGRYYFATDTLALYRDTGLAWVLVGGVPGTVAALPSTPFDGQEIYYLADAARGVVWHLRYRAASANAHKWEFVGGSPLLPNPPIDGGENAIGAGVSMHGPGLTIPLSGVYNVAFGSMMRSDMANVFLNIEPFAANPGAGGFSDYAITLFSGSMTAAVMPTMSMSKSMVISAGSTLYLWAIASSGSGGYVRKRWMSATPVYVG